MDIFPTIYFYCVTNSISSNFRFVTDKSLLSVPFVGLCDPYQLLAVRVCVVICPIISIPINQRASGEIKTLASFSQETHHSPPDRILAPQNTHIIITKAFTTSIFLLGAHRKLLKCWKDGTECLLCQDAIWDCSVLHLLYWVSMKGICSVLYLLYWVSMKGICSVLHLLYWVSMKGICSVLYLLYWVSMKGICSVLYLVYWVSINTVLYLLYCLGDVFHSGE